MGSSVYGNLEKTQADISKNLEKLSIVFIRRLFFRILLKTTEVPLQVFSRCKSQEVIDRSSVGGYFEIFFKLAQLDYIIQNDRYIVRTFFKKSSGGPLKVVDLAAISAKCRQAENRKISEFFFFSFFLKDVGRSVEGRRQAEISKRRRQTE